MGQWTAAATVCASLAIRGAAAGEALLYTNAELVSFDPERRMVGVRMNDGALKEIALDDGVSGPRGARAGDPVILAIRDETRAPCVTRIIPSVAAAARGPAAATTARRVDEGEPTTSGGAALVRYEERVVALARQAAYLDTLWSSFQTSCAATVRSTGDHDWFGLWNGQVQADLSNGVCREMRNQIVARGEEVKAGMSAADEGARRAALLPGTLREVKRRHAMEWDGWELPAPEYLRP